MDRERVLREKRAAGLAPSRKPIAAEQKEKIAAGLRAWWAARPGVVSYGKAHSAVDKARGKARNYACAHCGRGAKQWSYDRTDPDAKDSVRGPYSMDVNRYVPLCVPCHRAFDFRFTGTGRYAKSAGHRAKLAAANRGGLNRPAVACEDCGRKTINGFRCASCAQKRWHAANPGAAQRRRKVRCECGMESISQGGMALHFRKTGHQRASE